MLSLRVGGTPGPAPCACMPHVTTSTQPSSWARLPVLQCEGLGMTIPSHQECQDGQKWVPAPSALLAPAGHCATQGSPHCTYLLGQRGWRWHCGPVSSKLQWYGTHFGHGWQDGVGARQCQARLGTSPAVGSPGCKWRDGILWASK